jgi:hypothetical protein
MISLRAKEKIYWEREISLVNNFWLSTLKHVLAAWYHVQYCVNCIFMGDHKILMGWQVTHSIITAAPLDSSLQCTLSCLLLD